MGNQLSAEDLDPGNDDQLLSKLRHGANTNKRVTLGPASARRAGPRPGARVTPLCLALLLHNTAAVKALLEEGGADASKPAGLTGCRWRLQPLHLACLLGLPDAARALLEHGANPNAPVTAAAEEEEDAAAAGAAHGAQGDAAGAAAAAGGAESGLRRLLELLEDGDTPLHICAATGHVDALELLLHHANRPNANALNRHGATPLLKAVLREHVACAVLLATAPGADVATGQPLHAAIAVGAAELVHLLLQAGADALARNHQGHTPLQAATNLAAVPRFRGRATAVQAAVGDWLLRHQQPHHQQPHHAASASAAMGAAAAAQQQQGQPNGRHPQRPASALTPAEPLRRRQGEWSGDLPQCPRKWLFYVVSATAMLRARTGLSLVPLTAVLTAAFISHHVVCVALGAVRCVRGGGQHRQQQQRRGGGGSGAANAGSRGAHAGGGAGGGGGGGGGAGNDDDGGEALCAVCLSSRAVLGFLHASGDLVHNCLCRGCMVEMRSRGQLSKCLICKRRGDRLVRVVCT